MTFTGGRADLVVGGGNGEPCFGPFHFEMPLREPDGAANQVSHSVVWGQATAGEAALGPLPLEWDDMW